MLAVTTEVTVKLVPKPEAARVILASFDDVEKAGDAVAAIIVGIVESFSSFYASNFKEVIVFTLILPVLVLRSLAAPAVEEEKD